MWRCGGLEVKGRVITGLQKNKTVAQLMARGPTMSNPSCLDVMPSCPPSHTLGPRCARFPPPLAHIPSPLPSSSSPPHSAAHGVLVVVHVPGAALHPPSPPPHRAAHGALVVVVHRPGVAAAAESVAARRCDGFEQQLQAEDAFEIVHLSAGGALPVHARWGRVQGRAQGTPLREANGQIGGQNTAQGLLV